MKQQTEQTTGRKKISLVVTVLNEQATIFDLLVSITKQSILPDQVVVVDGGSIDQTPKIIQQFVLQHHQLKIDYFQQKSNRSQGRNLAVNKAQHPLIAITDAGCVLKEDWLEKLLKIYHPQKRPAVAGYYSAHARTDFEKAAAPFFLVMPNDVRPDDFLPATRSMLIEKKLWQELGGLRTDLKASEDYELAIRLRQLLKKRQQKIGFAREAIVYWQPAKNLGQFIGMVREQAVGDIRGGVVRRAVKKLYLKYLSLSLMSLAIAVRIGWFYGLLFFIFSVILSAFFWGWLKWRRDSWRLVWRRMCLQLVTEVVIITSLF